MCQLLFYSLKIIWIVQIIFSRLYEYYKVIGGALNIKSVCHIQYLECNWSRLLTLYAIFIVLYIWSQWFRRLDLV